MAKYGIHGTVGPAPRFTWSEVADGWGKLPKYDWQRRRIVYQARYLNALRRRIADRFGVHPRSVSLYVTSWYRSYWYNRKIGGARFSQHPLCRATDIVVVVRKADGRRVRLSPAWVGKLAAKIDAFRKGGIGVYGASAGNFTHVDHRPDGPARW